MKTSVKILIAGAVTAMAATFSTGASAANILEIHEQHKAQLLGFLFGGNQATVTVGPAYQAPPASSTVGMLGNCGERFRLVTARARSLLEVTIGAPVVMSVHITVICPPSRSVSARGLLL